MKINHTAVDRFLKYVQIDTQSDVHSKTIPSTMKQKDLGYVLVEELKAMGIADAEMDEWGYVYATVPSNTEKENVPVICFCSHMDTSPDASGTNVKPIVHENYQGADLILPDDSSIVIKSSEHPDLKEQFGNDIITASGLTLLGADNKAGVAEIMDAANFFMTNPTIKHGKIRILFTPDEEIGRGVDHLDMTKVNADYGYTLDGGVLGSIEDESFSADAVTIEINGVSAHPGYAKNKLVNALKVASDFIDQLPTNLNVFLLGGPDDKSVNDTLISECKKNVPENLAGISDSDADDKAVADLDGFKYSLGPELPTSIYRLLPSIRV